MMLSHYLHEATACRFDWSHRNCGLWAADWVFAQSGFDPAAKWRGVNIGSDFDLVAAADEGMRSFAVTDAPTRGDVGIVRTPLGPTAAICTGRRWAALAPCGLAVCGWPVLKAWSIA